MTKDQINRTKAALHRYRLKSRVGRQAVDRKAWAGALEQTLDYYDKNDAMRADLLRMRYIEHRSEVYTMEALNISRSTYYKARLDVLSTLAIFAAKQGANL